MAVNNVCHGNRIRILGGVGAKYRNASGSAISRKIGSISATWLVNHNLQSKTRISESSAQLLSGIRRGTQREIPSKRGRTTCGELYNEESSNPCLIIRLSSLNCFATLRFYSRWSIISPSETRDSSLLFLYLFFSAAKRANVRCNSLRRSMLSHRYNSLELNCPAEKRYRDMKLDIFGESRFRSSHMNSILNSAQDDLGTRIINDYG